VDILTLNTLQKIDLNEKLGVFSHAAHPHYDESGNMLTIGMRIGIRGPEYIITKFPAGGRDELGPFEGGDIIAKVPTKWTFEPGYMHSFAMTENYFILIEQVKVISSDGFESNFFYPDQVSHL